MENTVSTSGSLALAKNQYKVITIPAAEKQETVKLRVAAYARVSTASDDQMNSFAAQNAYYTSLITSNEKWRMVDIYADAGISGVTAEKRDDFQRLLADCRRGLVDRILVKSISRFARNTTQCLEIVRELKSIGVSVYFEEQRIDTATMSGEFLTSLFAAIAQKESESISAHMRWSYQQRMQSGTFIPSHQPFGYRLVDKQITIVPDEAAVVQRIFSDYLNGKNIIEIADTLNGDRSPSPSGQAWCFKSILTILGNEKYIGDSLWQKAYMTDTFPAVKRTNHGEKNQYQVEGTHPAIISKEVFGNAQRLLETRKAMKQQRLHPQENPFSDTILCGTCGDHLRRKSVRGIIYRCCKTHDSGKEKCALRQIPEREIEKAFLRLYYKLKHHTDEILSPLLRSLVTVRERRMLWSTEIIELNKLISELTSQNHRLTELKKFGGVDPDIFIYKSNELAEQLRAAKLQKERVLSAESDDTIPRTRELMETLEAGPERLASFDAELFGELVDKIIVESSERIRFRLKNGLELTEKIERTVR